MAGTGTPSDDTPSPPPPPSTAPKPAKPNRDFLTHLETYLAKRDGVDKLLKISRYASKIALSAPSLLPNHHPLRPRLKSFESSVGLSRKAFRLGKFVQDLNALRTAPLSPLPALAYGGEGVYYFTEQFVWLAKAGLIDPRHSRRLQKISAWAEFVGYVGSVWLKIRDLRRLEEERERVDSERERDLRLKIAMKRMSIVQDLADWLMTLSDVWDEEGRVLTPILLSCAGMVSALISTHKNWVSC